MEQFNSTMDMLELLAQPGLCAADGRIVRLNSAAAGLMLSPGDELKPLLESGWEEYQALRAGCLGLTLHIAGNLIDACVTRMEGFDLFILEPEQEQAQLQAMALAAKELRGPLAGAMITAGHLAELAEKEADPQALQHAARLNQSLMQLLRIVGNMSDSCRTGIQAISHQEVLAADAVLDEIFEKAACLVAQAGVTLEYRGLPQTVYTMLDRQLLERAVLNIIGNCLKFTPKGGHIRAELTRSGRKLCLQIEDNGTGVGEALRSAMFSRYLRQPSLEDRRYGIGLGMVLVRAVVSLHGGTVLIDQPRQKGTRVSLTLAIRQEPDPRVRCGRPQLDYTGEWDHALVELSQALPASLYGPEH